MVSSNKVLWKRMQQFALYLLSAITLFSAVQVQAADVKIGFVNVDRLMRESQIAKRYESQTTAKLNSARAAIEQLQKEFDQKSQAFQTERPTMADSMRQKRARELEDLDTTLNRKRRDFLEERDKLNADALREISNKANAVIKKIADAEKYDIIIQQAISVTDRVDITDRVLEEMNRGQ